MTTLPPISRGRHSRLMRNDLVRTAARYSRAAITSILRIAWPPGPQPGDADEDVVQGRPGQLEVPYPAAGRQGRQDLLRVGPPLQAEFLQVAEVGDLDDARQALQGIPAAVQAYPDRVPAVGLLD